MCTCTYTFMYTFIDIFIYIYIYIYVNIYIHTQQKTWQADAIRDIHKLMRIHMYISYICTCTYIHLHSYIHLHIHAYMITCIHVYMYTYIHTHAYTYTHSKHGKPMSLRDPTTGVQVKFLKSLDLFCRIWFLLQDSFAKELYSSTQSDFTE